MALMVIQRREREAGGALAGAQHDHRALTVTGSLALGALLAQLVLWLMTRRLDRAPDFAVETGFWQRLIAWVPVVTSGFVCHELAFVPGLDALRVALGTHPLGNASVGGLSFAFLPVVQAGTLSAGMMITFGVLLNLPRTD